MIAILTVIVHILCNLTPSYGDVLDEALASALFRPTSLKCPGAGTSTSFSATFSSTMSISKWHNAQALYEPNVFEVDMIHSDQNENRSWTLRIGKGGHVSSFLVKAGEAIANEANVKSMWNDLVPQMVAVNGDLNTALHPNFIHQSGPYVQDTGMPPPFYSPKLALDCSENSCSTVNWGQQAHVPTPHNSSILYYTRYRDCGNGIIEYDMIMHHFGQNSSDIYNFFDVPWSGIRTSTFQDMLVANTSGKLEHHFPLLRFSGESTQLRNLDTTGGFTTFTQDLTPPVEFYDLQVCVDKTKVSLNSNDGIVANVPCRTNDTSQSPFVFNVSEKGPGAFPTDHYKSWNVDYTVGIRLCNLQAPIKIGNYTGKGFQGVLMINNRSGFTFLSKLIIHYCWVGNVTYLHSNVTAAVLNSEFLPGDTINIKYPKSSTSPNDQLALSFVHGSNPEYPKQFYRGKSRLWYGITNSERDGTVWDVNWLGRLRSKETYFNRKYIITDALVNMESNGMNLRTETFEDVDNINDLPIGQNIYLWIEENSFGASVGNVSCSNAKATLACEGSTTPKFDSNAWFYITCGSGIMTTTNPYHFAVIIDGNKKPYLCNGESNTTRAAWKLLGYFKDCSSISNRVYIPDFCYKPPVSSPPTIATSSPLPQTAVPTTSLPTTLLPITLTPTQQLSQPMTLPPTQISTSSATSSPTSVQTSTTGNSPLPSIQNFTTQSAEPTAIATPSSSLQTQTLTPFPATSMITTPSTMPTTKGPNSTSLTPTESFSLPTVPQSTLQPMILPTIQPTHSPVTILPTPPNVMPNTSVPSLRPVTIAPTMPKEITTAVPSVSVLVMKSLEPTLITSSPTVLSTRTPTSSISSPSSFPSTSPSTAMSSFPSTSPSTAMSSFPSTSPSTAISITQSSQIPVSLLPTSPDSIIVSIPSTPPATNSPTIQESQSLTLTALPTVSELTSKPTEPINVSLSSTQPAIAMPSTTTPSRIEFPSPLLTTTSQSSDLPSITPSVLSVKTLKPVVLSELSTASPLNISSNPTISPQTATLKPTKRRQNIFRRRLTPSPTAASSSAPLSVSSKPTTRKAIPRHQFNRKSSFPFS